MLSDSVINYFDKSNKLTVQNLAYTKQIGELISFLLLADDVKHDASLQLIKKDKHVQARVITHDDGIVAGTAEIMSFFSHKGLSMENLKDDGDYATKKTVLITLSGNLYDMLSYERTMLNVLQRMSGIATKTYALQKKIGPMPRIAATRKTLWGWLDKKAVAVGGGLTHRLSLSDEILIKENHLAAISHDVFTAIDVVIKETSGALIELEVETYDQATHVCKEWIKVYPDKPLILLLDNFSVADAQKTIKELRGDNFYFELSGGINENNIMHYSETGADIISLGMLTHSAHALDMSLEIE